MWRVILLLLVTLWPQTAWAHSSIPGMQGLYWGLLHPFSIGPQLLALFALSLVLQQRQPAGEDMLISFLLGCILGAAAAAFGISGLNPDMSLALFAFAAGVLTASAITLPGSLLTGMGGIGGFLSGYVSWPDPGSTSGMMVSALGGIVGSALIIIVVAGAIELVHPEGRLGVAADWRSGCRVMDRRDFRAARRTAVPKHGLR